MRRLQHGRRSDSPVGRVALESALPLLVVAAVSIAVGLVAAALFLRSQLDFSFRVPGIAYWATVLGGLGASLAIAATSRSSTGPRDPTSPATGDRRTVAPQGPSLTY